MSKASLPQGTRDFGPEVVRKRNYIFSTIRNVFELYGFQPLETPAMENLETLMGKYGEEGDRLIFKILNNGLDNVTKAETVLQDFEKVMEGKNVKGITERALRYDLTIPFARYVAMNYNQLAMPFKRYQMQPVWRADRPQRGRYREFYQCDADVVGSNSLWNETELACIYARVFQQLRIPVEIKINSRKILAALAELCGGADKLVDITIAIDKLDKIGLEKVKEELTQRGLQQEQISIIENYLTRTESNETELARMKSLMQKSETGLKGIEEVETVRSNYQSSIMNLYSPLSIDFTLARGLNYYTGIIFEVKATSVQMGSIGGGGRYDDLTGLFDVPHVPGVGISFGVDRIYDVMEELSLFSYAVQTSTQVLFFNLGEDESHKAFEIVEKLREQGIHSELYPEKVKLDKQFKYAEKKGIPFVVIIGSNELEQGSALLKDIRTGKQIPIVRQEDLIDRAVNGTFKFL